MENIIWGPYRRRDTVGTRVSAAQQIPRSCFVIVIAFICNSQSADASRSICDRLATELRQRPLSAWTLPQHPEGAAWPALRFAPDRANSAKYGELSKLPQVKGITMMSGVGAGPAMDRVGDLYELYDIGGSAHCEMLTFIRSSRKGEAQTVSAPVMTHTRQLCDGVAGRLAQAFGITVYAEYGPSGPEADDEAYDLIPWSSGGWGKPCAVLVKHAHRLRLAELTCAASVDCSIYSTSAMELSSAYVNYRANGFYRREPFRFGTRASPAAAAAALSYWERLRSAQSDGTDYLTVTHWPVFGRLSRDDYDHTFSPAGFRFFSMSMDHTDFAVGIGYAGYGWNESNQILIGYYQIGGPDGLIPVAGAAIRREIASSEIQASD
jgi:hypothetical protein